jgi:hypothetical protein
MASLCDPLPDSALCLVRVTADGYVAAGNHWPCWQWVRQQLFTQDGLDAEEILAGMPTWEHDYRPVRLGYRGRPVPKITDQVPLSIHGLAYVCPAVLAAQQLVDAFLAALKTAVVMQRGMKPDPARTVELKVPGDDFTRTVNMAAGTELSTDQLFGLLSGEPATWLGVSQQNDGWTWDLTNARLTPYAHVQTIDDYLAQLDGQVALPRPASLPGYLPAMALPDAFDHLGLAWRIATSPHLFRIPRAAVPAKLTQPASSAEEFESRCSALCDMLKSFNFPAEGGSLNNMKARLAELLGEGTASRAHAAVDRLRLVFDLRAGQQHHGADTRAERAKTALGLAQFSSDWAAAWDHLRALVVQSLDTIREEISPLTD